MNRYAFLGSQIALVLIFWSTPAYSLEQRIYACVERSGGSVRLVRNINNCKATEIKVSWNIQGPKGEQGDPGPQGETGAQGIEGPPGPGVVVVDGNGEKIGAFVSFFFVGGRALNALVLTDANYKLVISPDGIIPEKELIYDAPGCVGFPRHLPRSNDFPSGPSDNGIPGEIFWSEPDENAGVRKELYYIPLSAEVVSSNFHRLADDASSCIPLGTKGYEVFPNDPFETGVFSSSFPPPIDLRYR